MIENDWESREKGEAVRERGEGQRRLGRTVYNIYKRNRERERQREQTQQREVKKD